MISQAGEIYMECLGRKRKGFEISSECQKDVKQQLQYHVFWSHFSFEDYADRKKKCRELVVSQIVDVGRSVIQKMGVATAPAYVTAGLELPGRGLKRKIGCIDAATRLGRKKKIGHEFELADTIGKGKFGSVILCRSKKTGEEFACKILKKGEEIVHREVEIMQHLSGHSGVVTLKAVYEDNDSFHLVMELCSGGRLLDQMARVGYYSEQKAAIVIKDLMLAIRYCHEMGVVHRDIKPENILLTSTGQMKLADFGLAVRILDGHSLNGVVGSPSYIAPEVFSGNYSEKVDIWSAGVLLHALLVGTLPFQGDSVEAIFDAIKKEKLEFRGSLWETVTQPARDLLSKMLVRNVTTRLTANEVLMHPWISFYTEPSPISSPVEPKKTNCRPISRQLTLKRATEPESKRLVYSMLSDGSSAASTSFDGSTELADDSDSGLVDVLTAAISRVRISEPKRSRIVSPLVSIQQECSSNMKSSNLCTAF